MIARVESTVHIEHLRGAIRVRLRGVIDERFNVKSFASLADRTDPVLIDLDSATRITSFGVREWMRALKDLPTQHYFFGSVRPALMAQFNSVFGFGGRGVIVSFYCPYECPECGNSFDVLLDLRVQREVVDQKTAPPADCPICKAAGEFDDLESSYFATVTAAAIPAIPPAIDALLGGVTEKRPLSVHKTVEGDLTILWLEGDLEKHSKLKRHADGLEGTVLVILEGVSTTTKEGLSRLCDLILAPSAKVYLARVPINISRAFAEDAALPRPPIISLVVHAICAECGASLSLDIEGWGAVPPQTSSLCPQCGKDGLRIAWSGQDALLAGATPRAVVPPEIKAYVKENADWQTFSSALRKTTGTAEQTKPIQPGARIGKYEIVRRLAFGGMAEVLIGRQLGVEGFEKKVVIKRILPHLARQPAFVKMFLEEARIAARLVHGNIVQIYDLIREGDDYFAILEFVRGADLNVLLKVSTRIGQKLDFSLATRITAEVCGALGAAHNYTDDRGVRKPIVHRDVSPHNILCSTDGAVKLTDFGIAKAADSLTDETGTGVLKGKVIFMPPEAIRGEPTDHRGDIYAAGVVLYQCLAGRNPFHRGGQLPSLRAVLDDVVPPISKVRPDVPSALDAIVERAMNRDPKLRYQTADELQNALETILSSCGRPAGSTQMALWVRALLARGRDMSLPVPINTPSATLPAEDQTVTKALRGTADPAAPDEWLEDPDEVW